jgi:hypothetical protein
VEWLKWLSACLTSSKHKPLNSIRSKAKKKKKRERERENKSHGDSVTFPKILSGRAEVWFPAYSLQSLSVDGKWCFQKTLVLVFQHGRIQAEHVGVNGVY